MSLVAPPLKSRFDYFDGLRGLAAFWVVLFHLWNRFYPGRRSVEAGRDPGQSVGRLQPSRVRARLLRGDAVLRALRALHPFAPGPQRTTASRCSRVCSPPVLASLPRLRRECRPGGVRPLAPEDLARGWRWVLRLVERSARLECADHPRIPPARLARIADVQRRVLDSRFRGAVLRRVSGALLVHPPLWSGPGWSCAPVGRDCVAYFAKPYTCFIFARHFEWFLGVLAAEYIARNPEHGQSAVFAAIAAAGLGVGLQANFDHRFFPLRDIFLAVGFFGLVLVAAPPRALLRVVLSWRPLVWLGLVSYSLYLVHVPIIDLTWVGFNRLVGPRLPDPSSARWLSLVSIPGCVITAWLFFRLVEKPFIKSASPRTPLRSSWYAISLAVPGGVDRHLPGAGTVTTGDEIVSMRLEDLGHSFCC